MIDRVRMIARLAGPDGVIEPGATADVDAETAERLVAGGFAEYVEPSRATTRVARTEEAVVEPAERAVSRRKSSGTGSRSRKKEATE